MDAGSANILVSSMSAHALQYRVTVRFSPDGRLDVAGDEISVSIKAKPERGKANRELVERLAEHFRVPESGVRILSGLASRKKLVDIDA
jgi:uncharacterized protein (TIGR00251 family)